MPALAALSKITSAGLEARFWSDIDSQEFTADGDWTKPTGATWVLIRIQAGGGAGGGAGATGAAQWSVGDGGGGGEYAEVWVLASSLTSTVAVTIGAGAAGVTTGAGLVGGTTSFGAYLTVIGGNSGSQRAASGTLNLSSSALARVGGSGGAGSLTADLRVHGGCGSSGLAFGHVGATNVRGGDGGGSHWSGMAPSPDGNQNGTTGKIYGGGGSGCGNSASQTARTSGSGAAGRAVILTLV